MNKIALYSLLLALCACGGYNSAIKPGHQADKENIILVGKIELNPAINDSWEEASKKDKDFMEACLEITPAAKKIDEDDLGDYRYCDFETNKFFALEVKPEGNMEITSINFWTTHKPYWLSNTDYTYYTNLKNPKFVIGTDLQAGKAYYVGTIKIDLAEKSFKKDDGKYDHDELDLVIPKSMAIANEFADAGKWFDENHSKNGKLSKSSLNPKESEEENLFKTVTTTTHYR
ncbi:MAG: hypothetical protein LBJ18_00290 [Rickettsiales bacterium]|jgi:hypothetical protein|nr:hypothetical protein [Rickettsiales bacterium]